MVLVSEKEFLGAGSNSKPTEVREMKDCLFESVDRVTYRFIAARYRNLCIIGSEGCILSKYMACLARNQLNYSPVGLETTHNSSIVS